MYECSKSNGNIVAVTKNTCYFRLDGVWNIHVETTGNTTSKFLDFNIFWGSSLPQETPRGSRLWRSYYKYFPLLRNIRISTNTPSQTPATRLGNEHENQFFTLCIYWKNLLFWYALVTLVDDNFNMPCNFSKVLKLYSSLHIRERNWSRNASHNSLQGKRRSAIGQFVFPVHSNIPAKNFCES